MSITVTTSWTKEKIFDQLSPLINENDNTEIPITFTATDIPDNVAQDWVNKHQEILEMLLSEDHYTIKVITINDELIQEVDFLILLG